MRLQINNLFLKFNNSKVLNRLPMVMQVQHKILNKLKNPVLAQIINPIAALTTKQIQLLLLVPVLTTKNHLNQILVIPKLQRQVRVQILSKLVEMALRLLRGQQMVMHHNLRHKEEVLVALQREIMGKVHRRQLTLELPRMDKVLQITVVLRRMVVLKLPKAKVQLPAEKMVPMTPLKSNKALKIIRLISSNRPVVKIL